jgi:hypothetical protein
MLTIIKQRIKRQMARNEGTGGEGGIRTLGTGVSPYNGLANRRIRPLCHLSGVRSYSLPRWIREGAGTMGVLCGGTPGPTDCFSTLVLWSGASFAMLASGHLQWPECRGQILLGRWV